MFKMFNIILKYKKGEDNVCVCKISDQKGYVQHYYNTGKSAPGYLSPSNPEIGITNAKIEIVNGQVLCSFTREKFINGVNNYFNLNESFYLLIVKGGVSGGEIQYHGSNKVISDNKIDFASNSSYSGSEPDTAKAKAHGLNFKI